MSIYKFETSFPFPIIKVTTLIHHTEVSKPTGISYIILVLVNESANKKEKLSHLLLQFGVPNDLHGIFADEIHKLIHELGIIECRPYHYNKKHFEEYEVGDFVFTEKGEKVFKEELIPVSKSIESKQELFYDPVHDVLMDKIPGDWKVGKIDTSILPNQFAEQFAYHDLVELEEYLNSLKGKGIIVKKDEVITNLSIISNEFLHTTFPITLSIDNDQNTIMFDLIDHQTQAFFEKHYDNRLISDALGIKRKFKFRGNQPPLIDTKIINGDRLMLPETYDEVLSKTSPLIITKSNYFPKQSKHVINSNTLLLQIHPNIETIHIHSKDKIIGYIPALASYTSKSSKGLVTIKVLAEHILNLEAKQLLIRGLIEEFKTYSIENARDSIYAFKVLNDQESIQNIFDKYLTNDIESNIAILREIKDTLDLDFIKDWFSQHAQNIYTTYFDKLPIKSIEHQIALGGWLIKHLKIQNVVMINKIIESNPTETPMKLFNLLESLNYSLNDIFSQVKVLDEFIQRIIDNDKTMPIGNFSNLIKTIQFSLNQLKDLSEIKNPHQFIIKEKMDREKFQDIYHGFLVKYNELLQYEKYSVKGFGDLNEYNKHFKYLNNLFTEEKNASSNPKSIDQKFIVSKINKKDYFSAVVYLFAKLEWGLKNQYKLSGTTETTIDELQNIESLKSFVPDLHQFRKTRNAFIHPSHIEVEMNAIDLTRWTNIVFKEVLKP